MNKKLLNILIIVCTVLVSFGVLCVSSASTVNVSSVDALQSANNSTNNFEGEFEFSDGVITKYTGTDAVVVIPDTINNMAVTSIGGSAFAGCTGLTSITIPDSVTTIGVYAFYRCKYLTQINWNAKNVADFSSENHVFEYAGQSGDGINVVFGDKVERIPAYCFYPYKESRYSPKIRSVTIGEGVTTIGGSAFKYCEYLTQINWNAKNVADFSSGDNVFGGVGQSGAGINVVFGDKVERIPAYCFYPCKGSRYSPPEIRSVIIGEGVTTIGGFAFADCTRLTSITIGEGVTTIGGSAFEYCIHLTSITIPDSVTAIGGSVFKDSGLRSVTIGEGVTTIGGSAFAGCTGLTSITIPDSVTTIGGSVFKDSGLRSVTIGEGVTTIGGSAFAGCTGLTSITIPDSVTTIGGGAFEDSGLTSITIPDSVTTIGVYAFSGCEYLTQINWNAKNVADFSSENHVFEYAGQSGDGINVVFGDKVERIPAYCFYPYKESRNSPKIRSVTIGEGVTTIGGSAFKYCEYLTQINWNAKNVADFSSGDKVFEYAGQSGDGINVVFGDEVERIPSYCFDTDYSSNSPKIRSVTIGEGVTTIGRSAFAGCKYLTQINWNAKNVADFSGDNVFEYAGQSGDGINVVFGDEVERIPRYCFYTGYSSSSAKITSVTIPDSVTTIGYMAFDCESFEKVNITSIEAWCKIDFDGHWSNPLYNAENLYLNGTLITNFVIPDSVTTIGDYAFYGYTGLSSITIPDSVTTIGDYAFYRCTGLTSITIGEGVTTIGDYAFNDCTGLTSITIPDSVTTIGDYAFYKCTGLTSITIGEGVTTIGGGAFFGCKYLTQINWNAKNVADFSSGDNVFGGAGQSGDGINVVFGDKVERIPAYCFYPYEEIRYSPEIRSVTIGEGVTTIGGFAFADCTGLTSITIPDSVTTIGDYAFCGCTGLTSLTIPGFILGIPSSIEKLTLTNETTIPAGAFCDYVNLTDITLNDGITSIGKDAFANCGYANNADNWDGDLLYCGKYLVDAKNTIAVANVKAETIAMEAGIFSDCAELLRVTLPESIVNIPNYAFYGCNNLLKITIPQNVSSIGEYAFYGCSGIIKINIPSKVEKIGYDAFGNCNSLAGVYITNINAWSKIEFGKSSDYGQTRLSTNPLYSARYLYINNELAENISITENITELTYGLFANCDSIKSVNLPKSLTSFGDYAFYDCDNLTRINIPANVTSIGNRAFYDCSYIKNVYITDLSAWCKLSFADYQENPLCYGASLYLNGKLLENLVIPEDITVLNNYTFYNCDSLKSVVLHDSIEKVEENVFYDCDNLKCVVIPENIFYIKKNSFYGCWGVSNVFFKGSQAMWDDMLIYSGNDPLNNASVICNAEEKTYKFETNCASDLRDITAYCLVEIPKPYNDKQALQGWYDNAALTGESIEFPYFGDATTLYAKWTERTGNSIDEAFYLTENEKITKTVDSYCEIYYEFTPRFSGEYKLYITGISKGSIYLYDKHLSYIDYDYSGGCLSYSYFEAGETYYLSIRSYTSTEISIILETDLTVGAYAKVSQDGKYFTVNVNDIPIGNEIILALYNGDEFVDLQHATHNGNEIHFTTDKAYTDAKIMIWNDFTSLKPACKMEIIN